MGLNIKNEDVHAVVRELAERLGVSQTSAVEQAVREKLDALAADAAAESRKQRRQEAIIAAQEAFRGVDLRTMSDELYDDETGMPS